MLFTTAVFAFLFLPVVLLGFYALRSPRLAAAWLLAASLFFYGWWLPRFTLLLVASIVFNLVMGRRIGRGAGDAGTRRWLVFAIGVDLALLGYFKYFNFFIDNLSAVFGLTHRWPKVLLPIGISFFTFTQIAFLVDAWRGRAAAMQWTHYGLFVTYFPHLIAGPILHHGQMVPQFAAAQTYRFDRATFATGWTVFAIGLIKKVVFADGVSPFADAVFNPVDAGMTPDFAEAWLGALAYTLQIYFDFSGYSDMAVGLSLLFNIRLPFNFESPYRATSISEFWRRWHISLSTFLRDYLYFAMGGNRRGTARRYANLLVTMLLGGLWHGANWTFVCWGALHGVYLCVNHVFRQVCGQRTTARKLLEHPLCRGAAWVLTLVCVVIAWVFFRAGTLAGAWRMLHGLVGAVQGTSDSGLLADAGLHASAGLGWCLLLACIALLPYNSNAVARQLPGWCRAHRDAAASLCAAALTGVLFMVVLNTARDATSAFIYFNF